MYLSSGLLKVSLNHEQAYYQIESEVVTVAPGGSEMTTRRKLQSGRKLQSDRASVIGFS